MGGSSSLITGTVAHTHSGTAGGSDGGALAANQTSFGFSSGSILYSDGTNIEELAIGNNGQTLTVSAGALPSWADGGNWEVLDTETLTSGNTEINCSFSSVAATDISRVVFVANIRAAASTDVELALNGFGGAYNAMNFDGYMVYSGSTSVINQTAQTYFDVAPQEIATGDYGDIQMVWNVFSGRVDDYLHYSGISCGNHGFMVGSGVMEIGNQTSISSIKLISGSNMSTDSNLTVYRQNVA